MQCQLLPQALICYKSKVIKIKIWPNEKAFKLSASLHDDVTHHLYTETKKTHKCCIYYLFIERRLLWLDQCI